MPQTENTNALPIGVILQDRFEIVEVLGEGGFGIAYKVKHIKINKFMVIKEYMPKQFASRSHQNTTVVCSKDDKDTFEWGLKRFLDEVKTLTMFEHPSIVKVHDYFEDNNTAYFVMDYYEGETLDEYIKRHPNKEYNQEEILSIIMPILEGLKPVHNKGFLHRDIAPDNIFLRVNKLPVLIDFGASREAIGKKSNNISAIIKQGYSPPEQYNMTSKQNATTDLYAVSAVMYELITGKKPPEGTHRQTLLFEGEKDPIEDIVTKYKDKYSKSFLETVQKGLNVKQKDRVQTISEYQDGLVGDSGDDEVKSPPQEAPKTPTNPCKALDDLIMLAGSDKIITKDEESMILKKAKELNIEEDRAKACIEVAIREYGWRREDSKNLYQTELEEVIDKIEEDKSIYYKDRIGRVRFIIQFAFLNAIWFFIILLIVNNKFIDEGLIVMLLGFGIIILLTKITIMRLHDLNRSGWDVLLLFIPIYNIYLILILFFKKGVDKSN